MALSLTEFARKYTLSMSTVRRMLVRRVEDGGLRGVKITGRRIVILPEEEARWLAGRQGR